MSGRILLWSVTSALAGLLFGFDTVAISGAEQTIQSLWNLSAGLHGIAIACALYGTVAGSLAGGWLVDRAGRRAALLFVGALYIVGSVLSALAPDVLVFMIARVLGGLGIGISTVAAPLYISEIAPPQLRGRLTGMFQLNIVIGILVAFLSNSVLAASGPNSWRWMLGVMAFPALLYTLCCLALPESPRWLITRRRDLPGALRVLRLIYPGASNLQPEAEAAAITAASLDPATSQTFWSWKLRRPIALAILIALFNQLSGINAILYFAPRIFGLAGLGAKAALLQSAGIGAVNLVFTLAGLRLIDRLGRRKLLYIGSFGYIASLSLVSLGFATMHGSIIPLCLFFFIASHAIGQGTVIWVYIAEIFPDRQRAKGQSLGSFTHWMSAALLTSLFPAVVTAFAPAYVFAFFALMMVLQLIWVKTCVIETKGASLESIQARMCDP
jgi:MFS transporter, SP family, arabinose:H+ symporter